MSFKHLGHTLLVVCLVGLSFASQAFEKKSTERADYIRDNYTKFEYSIVMRDGIELFTAVYSPNNTSKSYPMMMQRTPYRVAPYGSDRYKTRLGPDAQFEKDGFIFVFQDVRGKFLSQGKYINMRPQDAHQHGGKAVDDATDTYDTIEWLVNNVKNNNGKVGMWGTSYPGYYTSVAGINSHKALKALSPQAPIADWFFDDFHRNGAFVTPMAFLFFDTFDKQLDKPQAHWPKGMDKATPDGYDFFLKLGPLTNVNKNYFKGERPFWNELTEHPNYDDYWKARNVLPHLDKVKPATLVVGGWYDTEDLYGPLSTYQKMSKHNKKEHIKMIMGPWYHGQWNRGKGDSLGEADFGFDTSKWFQKNVLLPFFNHHLKGGDDPKLSTATMFETGSNRWREFDNWPPKKTSSKRFFLGAKQTLNEQAKLGTGFSDYVSDPAKPVPHSANISRGWDKPYMVEDQRFSARRPDVLTFETPVMTKDMTIAGAIDLNLWFSTSQSAADIVVKLVDVFPAIDENTDKVDSKAGNRHALVRWGVIRGRFRESMSEPKAFVPNQPTAVNFELYDVLHTIKRGHKLQIQIQSSLFPFIDRNPQKYVDNIFNAKDEDFVKANHKIYHNEQYPSSIELNLID